MLNRDHELINKHFFLHSLVRFGLCLIGEPSTVKQRLDDTANGLGLLVMVDA